MNRLDPQNSTFQDQFCNWKRTKSLRDWLRRCLVPLPRP